MHGPDEQLWIDRLAPTAGTTYTSPDYENLRTTFERSMTDGDTGLALRLVASLPELINARRHSTRLDWAERAIEAADPDHPQYRRGGRGGSAGSLGDSDSSRTRWTWRRAPTAAHLSPAIRISLTPAMYSRMTDSSVIPHRRWRTMRPRARRRAPSGMGRGWCGVSTTPPSFTIWWAARRRVCPRRRKRWRSAKQTQNPSAMAMAVCAIGRALKTVGPAAGADLLRASPQDSRPSAEQLADGCGPAETAAVRAEHDDPATAARLLLDVLDHWSQGGPGVGAQHWYTIRYVARLLKRVGADADAEILRRALVGAATNDLRLQPSRRSRPELPT